MERLICFCGEVAINRYQIMRARNFARNNNLILAQTVFQGEWLYKYDVAAEDGRGIGGEGVYLQ